MKHEIQRIRRNLINLPPTRIKTIPMTPYINRKTRSVRNKRRVSQSIHWNNNYIKPSQVLFINEGFIGSGSFSDVYKVRDRRSNKVYALKRSKKSAHVSYKQCSLSNYSTMRCLGEAAILTKLQSEENYHPNICKFFLFFFSNDCVLQQVYEFYPYGNLKQLIQTIQLSSIQILQVLGQIVTGLCYIHSKNIIHCDMKPENILVEKVIKDSNVGYLLKIGDFGISVDLDNGNGNMELNSGDGHYIPPEILDQMLGIHSNNENLKKIDVYSLGIILIELVCDIKLPPQGDKFRYLRNIDENTEINWSIFLRKLNNNNTMGLDDEQMDADDKIICVMKNELIPKMIQKHPQNRIDSHNLLLLLNERRDKENLKNFFIECSKLNLVQNVNNSNDKNGLPVFCCDETKLNSIPIKKPSVFIELDDEEMEVNGELMDGLCKMQLEF